MLDTVTDLSIVNALPPTELSGLEKRFVEDDKPSIQKRLNYREMREVAEELESVFLNEMLKPMFSGIEPAEPFGGGAGEDIYRDMQVSEYSKELTKRGGVGIADAVMEQLIRLQEAA